MVEKARLHRHDSDKGLDDPEIGEAAIMVIWVAAAINRPFVVLDSKRGEGNNSRVKLSGRLRAARKDGNSTLIEH